VPYEASAPLQAIVESKKTFKLVETRKENTTLLVGDDAIRAAGRLLPAINAQGAKRAEVQSAVGLIEQAPAPDALFSRYAGRKTGFGKPREQTEGEGRVLTSLPMDVRLALEMM